MNNRKTSILSFIILIAIVACKKEANKSIEIKNQKEFNSPDGMVWVKGKTFLQGAKQSDNFAMPREKPAHEVRVDGFFIDATEVTNKQFKQFIDATKYITIAERPIDWEEMKKQLPKNTLKPHDSILQPGSLIFNKNINAVVNMNNYFQWWIWKIGANWKHPEGPDSTIIDRDNFPVVHNRKIISIYNCRIWSFWMFPVRTNFPYPPLKIIVHIYNRIYIFIKN